MARNEEKQLGRLNRWILQQEKEEFQKKNPPRPKLHTLGTTEDVKKWLPSIVRDIDINLKQSQVVCYTPEKIELYRNEVMRLQREYSAFLKKFKSLNKDDGLNNEHITPWTERSYQSSSAKRQKLECNDDQTRTSDGETPTVGKGSELCNEIDKVFVCALSSDCKNSTKDRIDQSVNVSVLTTSEVKKIKTPILQKRGFRITKTLAVDVIGESGACNDLPLDFNASSKNRTLSGNILGLDYDSSDSDEGQNS